MTDKVYELDGFVEDEVLEYFNYLDQLRESGVTNMYGAAYCLEEEFNLDVNDARLILARWMETFSERHPKS